jgi:hypothetical protein
MDSGARPDFWPSWKPLLGRHGIGGDEERGLSMALDKLGASLQHDSLHLVVGRELVRGPVVRLSCSWSAAGAARALSLAC